ncbi:hypothetical protein ACFQ7M_19495 [Streptomyces massasporeus]
MTVHRQGADVQRRFDDVAGRALLQLAVVLHRAVAGRVARERWQQRRNAVLRAAAGRGVPVQVLAARLGLSEGWVRQVLNGRKPAEPPVIEEAA